MRRTQFFCAFCITDVKIRTGERYIGAAKRHAKTCVPKIPDPEAFAKWKKERQNDD